MSTRSGKRIQSSPQDINGEDKTSRNGIKTRSKRLTKNTVDEQLAEKKRKKHYVKYPTEEIIDENDSNGKSKQTLRKSRRNTLKDRNVNDTSAEESESRCSQKTTRRTKRCEDPDDNVVLHAVEDVGEKNNKKKSKKKKIALVVNENKLHIVHNDIIVPSMKKSHKKKNKKNSGSMIVEEVTEHSKVVNTSETSVDSFHSAAGSPEHNVCVKKSTPNKSKYSTETHSSPSVNITSTKNEPTYHTVNQNVLCQQQNSCVLSDDQPETRRLRKRKSSACIANEAVERNESTEDCTTKTKQSKNIRKKKIKVLKSSFDGNDLISKSCKETLKDTFKCDDAAYTKSEKKKKANSLFDETVEANATFDNKNKTNTTYDKEDYSGSNIFDKKDRFNVSFDSKNKANTKFVKNDKRNSTFTNEVGTDISNNKEIEGNTTYFDKEDKLNGTFDKDKMNTTFEKKSNANSTFDKNEKHNSTFFKEDRTNMTFDKENEANTTFNKEDKANTTIRKVDKANGTFDECDKAKSALNKEERANTTFDKEEITNTTFDKEDRINTTFDKVDRSNKTFDKQEKVNSTFDKEDRLNTTFDKEDRSNRTFDKQEKVNSTFDKEDRINSTFDKENKSNSTFDKINGIFHTNGKSICKNKERTNTTFDKEDKASHTFDKSNVTFDKEDEVNSTLDNTYKANSTFDKENKTNSKFANKNGEIIDKILKVDSEMSPKQRNSAVKKRNSIKIDKTKVDRNISLNNISNGNANDSILTSDTSKSSHISVTSDESLSENILNATPLLVESSLEEENISKSSTSSLVCDANTTIPPTPLKREGTFTKESPEVKVTSKNKMSLDKTPIRRKSLPSPGCTPFPHAKSLSKDKSILNITRSIERSRRSSIAEIVPRVTKVMFCSPSNNPVVVSQMKGKIIKSSLKGSNKSFIFEDNSRSSQPRIAGRKRSQTSDRATGAEPHAKRSRLVEPSAPSPRPTRLRTRTLSASAKFLETVSAMEKADSPAKERVRTRLPNFAALHARQFARMESLDECQRRRAQRARLLLTPTGPVAVDRVSPNENRAPKQAESITVKKTETPTKGKPTPLTAGYSRFGFKLQADVSGNPFSFTAAKAAGARAESRPMTGLKRQATMPSLAGTTRKQLARQAVMREKSFTGKRDDNRQESRTVIKGVRTNRRFELQMKMRNINT